MFLASSAALQVQRCDPPSHCDLPSHKLCLTVMIGSSCAINQLEHHTDAETQATLLIVPACGRLGTARRSLQSSAVSVHMER